MYNYYSGKGSTTSAVKRSIIEADMVSEHHWLPQDINKIPYKKLQEMSIINRQKNETAYQQQALNAQAQDSKTRGTRGRGQQKRVQVTKY